MRDAAEGGPGSSRARTLTPDPVLGFYGPGTQMWRINREAVLLGAGPTALLLQIAHPLVAEGVAQHSRFEEDPFRRLRITLTTTMDLVFGGGPTAERALRRLNGVHATVRGEVVEPRTTQATGGATAYRAMDPALLLWVQATLVVSSVRAYERWVGPLTAADKEQFWQEARRVGPRMGIPMERSPAAWPALMDYWDAMLGPSGPIQVTATARRIAPAILRPPLPHLPGALVDALALPGLALLPPRVREGFGVAWSPGRRRAAWLLGQCVRLWVRAVPSQWRAMPQARAAERRVRAAVPDWRAAGRRRPTEGGASIQSQRPISEVPDRAPI